MRTPDIRDIVDGLGILALFLLLVGLMTMAAPANAFDKGKPKPEPEPPALEQAQSQRQDQHQLQQQSQLQQQQTSLETDVSVSNAASNEGNTLETGEITVEGDQVENNSSNVVLVPNNNTESCVRVFGLAFGRNGESGAFGVPWRSKRCDFEQAADDAFAAGERELGWFWKCHNSSLYRQFSGLDKDAQIAACHDRMIDGARDEVIEELELRAKRAESRAEAAENQADLVRRHERVCNESLERCEQKAYGGK